MYERFTDRARKIMQLAHQEAHRFNHEFVGTEHILLGLAKEGNGVAANVLFNLGVNLRMLRMEVDRLAPGGPDLNARKLPLTPRADNVIEHALDEARRLGHNYVATEHLLLGVLREPAALATQVLANLGLQALQVRKETLNLLGHELDEE